MVTRSAGRSGGSGSGEGLSDCQKYESKIKVRNKIKK